MISSFIGGVLCGAVVTILAVGLCRCASVGDQCKESRRILPRSDILNKCPHFAHYQYCDNCPDGYNAPTDCPVAGEWIREVSGASRQ